MTEAEAAPPPPACLFGAGQVPLLGGSQYQPLPYPCSHPEQLGWKFQEALTSQACPHATRTLAEPLSAPGPHGSGCGQPLLGLNTELGTR